ncbi:TIGR00289 family protein [Candidatus Woesearchaeota archaeon CG10_big_fil_rev_8_21_14_0_10_45_5]|nr:MAG: TIGR00289 family protein [Candidatus Woesearchaeota archaeon CG10_big_fil_rev_8_21_14_0_10_45_5]PIU30185.1 MAG: TIGR00289 family protein [Candidatus Woesearchaeota archaeon CG07_land_8_20_14_0_80_44_23]
MKLGVLFSGGKDSCYAMHIAAEKHEIACLISIFSKNTESYMFHTANIELVKRQAEALGIPLLIEETEGEKEKELFDLKNAIKKAVEKYHIKGIVTGAIASNYQKERIGAICEKLGIECINPLWGKEQFQLLQELVEKKFEVIVVGVFALGLENFLGRKIDKKFISDIRKVYDKYMINPSGEGGEYETFVLNAPKFKHGLEIRNTTEIDDREGGKTLILELRK